MSRLSSILLVFTAALALSACSKKRPEELPPSPGPAVSQSGTGNRTDAIVPGSQADFLQQMAGDDVIYFDTDRFNIDSVDAAALQKQVQWLNRYPGKRATIEGHAVRRQNIWHRSGRSPDECWPRLEG